MNLYEETTEVLKEYHLTWKDVEWVGCGEFYIPLEDVPTLFNVEYDSGYGAPEIAQDLLVVGKGWWLEREEYDGSEWWNFHTCPSKPKNEKKIWNVLGSYCSLEEANTDGMKEYLNGVKKREEEWRALVNLFLERKLQESKMSLEDFYVSEGFEEWKKISSNIMETICERDPAIPAAKDWLKYEEETFGKSNSPVNEED